MICGQREGERCYNNSIKGIPENYKKYENCGEGLECRIRTDMEPNDLPEAICYCIKTESLCGSDGNTYENECQLNEQRYRKRNGLHAITRGPCKTGKHLFKATFIKFELLTKVIKVIKPISQSMI